ncbi:MAG: polysaccharide deacetylase family protein, partial [Methyloligellaceae bacterium]
VLTFDDGPHPKHTRRILRALDRECVKATFFPIGVWARHIPHVLQMVADRGHTIGAHSWSHPSRLGRLSFASARKQIEKGFKTIQAAVDRPIAPFFRYPGLNDTAKLNAYLGARNTAVFSCDIPTDDWRGIGARTILRLTLARLRRRGRGIILFHDTKATTARALPALLRALKRGGYKIVHIVPRRPYDPVPPAVAIAQAEAVDAPAAALLETP